MSNFVFIPNGGVSSPEGFKASGVTAGFKRSGAPDFAMVYSETPANFAGAFTRCTFAAAPVKLCQKRVREEKFIQAVIINSGNANACTGGPGMEAAEESCRIAGKVLNLSPGLIMASSTGRIGVQLPMDKIAKGVELAAQALSRDGSAAAAQAIMTTDTVAKSVAAKLTILGREVTIGAMTKGAGMIDPDLRTLPHATMLCYITTDAKVDNALLTKMLGAGADRSFNRITVDGDMSTNDTVILMANGKSGAEIKAGSADEAVFFEALLAVMQHLAKMMAVDGEGATKFVEINVKNAPTEEDAKKCAEAVANSLLCKTAWFGGDPNWGRVVAALGYSGAAFDPEKVFIYFGGIAVVKDGGNAGVPETELAPVMAQKELQIDIDLGSGPADYWVWTCDISYEYVKINADYHT